MTNLIIKTWEKNGLERAYITFPDIKRLKNEKIFVNLKSNIVILDMKEPCLAEKNCNSYWECSYEAAFEIAEKAFNEFLELNGLTKNCSIEQFKKILN